MAHASLFILTILLTPAARAQMDPSTALLLRGPTVGPDLDRLSDEVHVAPVRRRSASSSSPHIVITPESPAPELDAPARPPAIPAAAAPVQTHRAPAAQNDHVPELGEESLSVRLQAGYLGVSSRSANPSRDYSGGGAGVNLGITLWATHAIGFRGDYLTTIGADVHDQHARLGLDHQEFDVAAIYRAARVGPRWTLSLGYHQLSNQVARRAGGPVGHRSRGADLGATFILPQTAAYAHHFEAHLQPYLDHDELGSADRATAGAARAAFGGSLAFGGHVSLEGLRRVFWRARYTHEHDAFARAAAVDVGQVWFTLGAKWGG